MLPKSLIHFPPDSAAEIAELTERALRRAGALGKLPTPLDEVLKAANIKDDSNLDGGIIAKFLSGFDERTRRVAQATIQKLRGLSDMRERAIYVPTDSQPRERFAKAHEIGHQDIPWHNLCGAAKHFYEDDEGTLSPETKDLFEREANHYAAEIIYQGRDFVLHARSYRPSFDAVFKLADLHGASKQATLHRYVEAQDELVAAVSYLPNRCASADSEFVSFRRPRLFGSPRFLQKYADIFLPPEIVPEHEWAQAALNSSESLEGYIELFCGASKVRFWWQAWWNTYTLLVLLRREPRFSIVGRLIRH